jgi:hypothetical protein
LLELGIAHLIGGVAAEGLPERDRPQQAADVISPKRWTAFARRHSMILVIFYRSIDRI